MKSTYPKTAYQVSGRHGVFLVQRILLRETSNYYFFADRYTLGREDKVFKDRTTVCFTFEEAKATLIKVKERLLERAKTELEDAKVGLAEAEALTRPTHKDEPVEAPTGPIRV